MITKGKAHPEVLLVTALLPDWYKEKDVSANRRVLSRVVSKVKKEGVRDIMAYCSWDDGARKTESMLTQLGERGGDGIFNTKSSILPVLSESDKKILEFLAENSENPAWLIVDEEVANRFPNSYLTWLGYGPNGGNIQYTPDALKPGVTAYIRISGVRNVQARIITPKKDTKLRAE